jgi:hypothetical protein
MDPYVSAKTLPSEENERTKMSAGGGVDPKWTAAEDNLIGLPLVPGTQAILLEVCTRTLLTILYSLYCTHYTAGGVEREQRVG